MDIEEQIRIIVHDSLGDPDDYPNLIADFSKLITKEIKRARLEGAIQYNQQIKIALIPDIDPTYLDEELNEFLTN